MFPYLGVERKVEVEGGKEQELTRSGKIDWGRRRAPWLGQLDTTPQLQLDRIKYFGWVWDAAAAAEISVACKGDDAEVNLALWAVGGEGEVYEKARGTIRNFLWYLWYRRLSREARSWLKGHPGEENRIAINDCLHRSASSDWWNWNQGSRLYFWRWPALWFQEARDGSPGFHFKQPRPRMKFPSVPIQEDWIREKDKEKLEKLIRRGYITKGYCRLTVPRFPVPKGSDDIRVVWDLAKNGLNETMYTPSFFLATMSTYIRRIGIGFYGGDFDIGEQFHNYILHESEQVNCGVEIPQALREQLLETGLQVDQYMRWGRLVFGWQSSPYLALRMLARALEIAKGAPTERGNPFGWDKVELNLPGSEDYDPMLGRVRKLNSEGQDAADIVSFYDDGRVFGATEKSAHLALRQITSRLQHLGNQDAARKRRKISQRPGAWAGGIAHSDQNTLRVFVSEQKWNKAREFLDWVWEQLHQPHISIERKRFRSGKGFLVYMSTCYEFIQPYLKGFHLSEDAWRKGRDKDGWKQKNKEIESDNDNDSDEEDSFLPTMNIDDIEPEIPNHIDSNAPPFITPVNRLREDVPCK